MYSYLKLTKGKVGIIGTSNNITDLRILESLHIHKHKPILNSTVSAFPLSIVKITLH